jgi:hypothetical protein
LLLLLFVRLVVCGAAQALCDLLASTKVGDTWLLDLLCALHAMVCYDMAVEEINDLQSKSSILDVLVSGKDRCFANLATDIVSCLHQQ